MFFDEVKIEVEGGKGGNGMVFFHREKFVECGAPDGGNGGDGGNVVVEADDNYNTLQHFTGLKHFKAQAGEAGYKNNMAGHAGEDLLLKVPVGTLIYEQDTEELLVDLKANGDRVLLARGGRGGYGNSNFVSSTRQAPDFAEVGDIGEFKKLRLELRLLADVGLVGFPSAGKSTLVSHVSSAKPKIAAYPFTTLIPHLGVVYLSAYGGSPDQSFVIADIPGIIEGASEGKGLGGAFLKHISRTASLIFVLDPFSYDGRSLAEQYKVLVDELGHYDPELLKKASLVLINKMDSIPEEDRVQLQKEFLKAFPRLKKNLRLISGVSGEGIPELLFELYESVQTSKKTSPLPAIEKDEEVLYTPHVFVDEKAFTVEHVKAVDAAQFREPVYGQSIDPELMPKRNLYRVRGKRIEQISRMTDVQKQGGIDRVYDVLKKMKIHNALLRDKAQMGDYIQIGPHIFEFHDL